MLGHMSGAYTARVSQDLALSSRFDFNVYSFQSEWAMGVEWWLRRPPKASLDDTHEDLPASEPATPSPLQDINGVVKARASTNNVRF
jgi:distribution and morphology protein 10